MTEDTFDQMQADFFEDDDEVGQPQAKSSSNPTVLTPAMRALAEDIVEGGAINTLLEDDAEEDYRQLSNVPSQSSGAGSPPKFRLATASRLQEEDGDDPEEVANSGFKVTVPQAQAPESAAQEASAPPPATAKLLEEPPTTAASADDETTKATAEEAKKGTPARIYKADKQLQERRNASRFRLKEEDLAVINFTNLCRYASYRQFSVLLECSLASAKNRANRLVKYGYMARKVFTGGSSLYYLTDFGQSEADRELPVAADDFSERLVKHTLATNDVMLSIMKGTFPGISGTFELDDFLTEHELRAETFEARKDYTTSHLGSEGWDGLKKDRDLGLRSYRPSERKTPPEFDFLGTPFFTMYGEFGGTNYHFPDLVLRLPRAQDGTPRSIAFEIELNKKKPETLYRIIKGLKAELDLAPLGVYGKVVYLVKNDAVKRHVTAAAARAGMKSGQFVVATLDKIQGGGAK